MHHRRLNSLRFLLTAALLWASAISPKSLVAAGAPGSPQSQYRKWVGQLGDPAFVVREDAAKHLLKAGLPTRSALLQGIDNPDLEIRMGAHRVLMQLLQSDFESKLNAFLETGRSDIARELSGWDRFAEAVGSGRAARELFVEMVRSELTLLNALVGKEETEKLASLLARRMMELANTRVSNGMRGPVPLASLATVLFVATQPEVPRDVSVEGRFYSLLMHTTAKQTVQAGRYSSLLKKLLSQWIERQSDNPQSYYALRLTLTYEMNEIGARMGRRLLQRADVSSHIVPFAAITLARFGSRADATYLLPQLENTDVCHTWSNRQIKKEPIRIQVRDVVLALLVHMTGQEPKDYGYQLLSPDEETLYKIYTFGFLEDKQRDDALAKWSQWLGEHDDAFSGPTDKASGEK